MTDEELREQIARELFDIWKEAKSTEIDNWDDVTWETLPEKHMAEYLLTAGRIIEIVIDESRKAKGIPPVLSDEEINAAIEEAYTKAEDYDDKGFPIPERNVAIRQRDADVRYFNERS